MSQHSSPISSIASYGKYIATAGYDNQVILWNNIENNKQFLGKGFHDHLANYVTFSPNGKFLLSTSSDYSARLWSIPDMKLLQLYNNHDDDVENASFSGCGNFIATASRDHKVRIFKINGELYKIFIGHTADVLSVVWSNNDKELISCGDDGTIRVWDIQNNSNKSTFNFNEVETDTCDAFKNIIFAGNDSGEINSINLSTKKLFTPIKAHQAGIKSIKINIELKWLLSSSYDKTIKLWQIDEDKESLNLIKEIKCPNQIWLRATNIVDKNTLAFGTFDSCYALFDLQKNEWNLKNINTTHGINAVAYSNESIYSVGDSGMVYSNDRILANMGSLCNFLLPVEECIFTGGQSGALFDAKSGTIIYQNHSPLNCGTTFKINNLTHVIIGTYTGQGLLFKLENNNLIFLKSVQLHSNAIKGISSNNEFIFSVSANRDAAFHNIETIELVKFHKQSHDLIANGADWLSNNKFVSISRDKKLRIWDNLSEIIEITTPHTNSIKCIKVSTNNRALIATGSYNGLFCVYNTKSHEWFYINRLCTSGISSISFDNRKNEFLASSYNGKIYVIPV